MFWGQAAYLLISTNSWKDKWSITLMVLCRIWESFDIISLTSTVDFPLTFSERSFVKYHLSKYN